jgi:hypothetical protein
MRGSEQSAPRVRRTFAKEIVAPVNDFNSRESAGRATMFSTKHQRNNHETFDTVGKKFAAPAVAGGCRDVRRSGVQFAARSP